MQDPQAEFGLGVGLLVAAMLLVGAAGLASQFGVVVAVGLLAAVLVLGLVGSIVAGGVMLALLGILASGIHAIEVTLRRVLRSIHRLLDRD